MTPNQLKALQELSPEPEYSGKDYFDAEELKEDWKKIREDEIRGKIRHGLCCAYVRTGEAEPCEATKKAIREWTEFIMTGE